jgi:lipid-A-disaccharide synthase
MAAAGVRLVADLTQHAVVGLWEVVKRFQYFWALKERLMRLAIQNEPEVIILIDFSGFNLRLARAIRRRVRSFEGTFANWRPRLVQYVSPQVWASRPDRARRMAEDMDLLLSIFPFEREWYARRAPRLPVEFVGHPLVDRFQNEPAGGQPNVGTRPDALDKPTVLLLPGSRTVELQRHIPVMLDALSRLRAIRPSLRARMVLPNAELAALAGSFQPPPDVAVQTGDLPGLLRETDVAIASTGTVTLECACFRVPTVAIYKTSWSTYSIAKRLIRVPFLAMPNLLAGEELFPELIQDAATPERIAAAALDLLADSSRRQRVQAKLAQVIQTLGPPGASRRAAEAILKLLQSEPRPLRASLAAASTAR